MSKASQIIVLCEDKAHEVFVTHFLKKWGVKPHAIRVPPYPAGKGSGKQYVMKNISLEAKALRSRCASTILLVVQDADEHSLDQVKSNLDAKIQPPRDDQEPIVYIVPKWHIETWIAYLDGENVNENDKKTYKDKYGKISEQKAAHPFIANLADNCKNHIQLESPPPSLISACKEYLIEYAVCSSRICHIMPRLMPTI